MDGTSPDGLSSKQGGQFQASATGFIQNKCYNKSSFLAFCFLRGSLHRLVEPRWPAMLKRIMNDLSILSYICFVTKGCRQEWCSAVDKANLETVLLLIRNQLYKK